MFTIKPVNHTFFFKVKQMTTYFVHDCLSFVSNGKATGEHLSMSRRNELVKCEALTELTSLFLMNAPHLLEQKLNFHRLKMLSCQAPVVIDSQVDDYVIMNV